MTKEYFGDTIFALSSGGLPSGVAIIRLSGPQTRFALETLIGNIPTPRMAVYSTFRDHDKLLIDKGLSLFFPAPHSFTGEDVGELQLHGSVAVVQKILSCLAQLPNFRLAEAGEFSRRAFANGKMDLTAAEGLSDLIAAQSEAQRVLALRNADGAQFALYASWNKILLQNRAYLEAEIDFSDEEGVPGSVADQVYQRITTLRDEIKLHAQSHAKSDIIRDGFRVVIVGAPNAGKSTLLNALLGRDAAIVSSVAGTTRDLVEQHMILGNHKFLITDTAGLHESDDDIEKQGMVRALNAVERAHLIIYLSSNSFEDIDLGVLGDDQRIWHVGSKIDLTHNHSMKADFKISAKTGHGIDELLHALEDVVSDQLSNNQQILPTRYRHKIALDDCLRHLNDMLYNGSPVELRSESLRLASQSLEELIGVIGVEDVLGSIFSEFCVGK